MIENSYCFEMNTKYSPSNMMKIVISLRVREIFDIFNTWDEIFFGIYRIRNQFSFYFSVEEN